LSGGNQSGNGTSIWQVLSPIPASSPLQHQLPPAGTVLNANYNSIELLTTTPIDTIFSKYIQTFAGAGNPPPGQPNPNSVVTLIHKPPPPVTATDQIITFQLVPWENYLSCLEPLLPCPLQEPFSVQTERFDTTAHTISAVTLPGHPLAGWRYWRVFSIGTNDLVVETAALDTYAGSAVKHPLNWAGYYVDYLISGTQLKTWEDDLRYILKAVQSNDDSKAVQGTIPRWNIVKGVWNPSSPDESDILNTVCQAQTCH
jgi:hypothetical protein